MSVLAGGGGGGASSSSSSGGGLVEVVTWSEADPETDLRMSSIRVDLISGRKGD